MKKKEDNSTSKSSRKVNTGSGKKLTAGKKGKRDVSNEKNVQTKPKPITKKEQEAFIHNIEETENLIDPGNEHRHITGG